MDTITKRRLALEEAIEETSESIVALRTGPQNRVPSIANNLYGVFNFRNQINLSGRYQRIYQS